jgi:uncharacterized protein (TIGR02271 family)
MSDDKEPEMLPLVEERLTVTKEQRSTGRVRVATRTETSEQLVPLELSEVDVEVLRVPVERIVDAVPDVFTEGDVTVIPVVEERLVVTTELFLREEIHVRRVARREHTDVPVTVRRQTAHVERLPPEDEG